MSVGAALDGSVWGGCCCTGCSSFFIKHLMSSSIIQVSSEISGIPHFKFKFMLMSQKRWDVEIEDLGEIGDEDVIFDDDKVAVAI